LLRCFTDVYLGIDCVPRGAGVGLDHHQLAVAILIHHFEEIRASPAEESGGVGEQFL
jgi:hypothetical protein